MTKKFKVALNCRENWVSVFPREIRQVSVFPQSNFRTMDFNLLNLLEWWCIVSTNLSGFIGGVFAWNTEFILLIELLN